jgi:hypothetical protein
MTTLIRFLAVFMVWAVSVVNALSEYVHLIVYRDGQSSRTKV